MSYPPPQPAGAYPPPGYQPPGQYPPPPGQYQAPPPPPTQFKYAEAPPQQHPQNNGSDGCLKGCLAGLACCCCLEICCDCI